jgi:hypothetical protein
MAGNNFPLKYSTHNVDIYLDSFTREVSAKRAHLLASSRKIKRAEEHLGKRQLYSFALTFLRLSVSEAGIEIAKKHRLFCANFS